MRISLIVAKINPRLDFRILQRHCEHKITSDFDNLVRNSVHSALRSCCRRQKLKIEIGYVRPINIPITNASRNLFYLHSKSTYVEHVGGRLSHFDDFFKRNYRESPTSCLNSYTNYFGDVIWMHAF